MNLYDLTKPLKFYNLVFFDLETTGLHAKDGDAICEIGAFKVLDGEIVDSFHSLINPGREMSFEAQRIHKIPAEELESAPCFRDLEDQIIDFLKDSVLCAYNVAFDLGFINEELFRLGKPSLNVAAVDILSMARKTLNLPKSNLAKVASFLNIESKGRLHRALADSDMAKGVFYKLVDILAERGLKSLSDYLSLYGLNNSFNEAVQDLKAEQIKKAIFSKKDVDIVYFSYENCLQEEKALIIDLLKENGKYHVWYRNCFGDNLKLPLNRLLSVLIV